MGKLTTLLTGLLIVALVFTGMITFLGDLQTNYNFTISDNFTTLYSSMNLNPEINQTTNVDDATRDIHQEFNSSLSSWDKTRGATNWYSWADWMLKSFSSAISTTAKAGSTSREMVVAGGEAANIPGWVTNTAVTILLIIIVLMIVGYLLNRDF